MDRGRLRDRDRDREGGCECVGQSVFCVEVLQTLFFFFTSIASLPLSRRIILIEILVVAKGVHSRSFRVGACCCHRSVAPFFFVRC